MKKPYTTECTVCDNPVIDCTCEDGPTFPDQEPFEQCYICGSDQYTATYRRALLLIMLSEKKSEMRRLANEALHGRC